MDLYNMLAVTVSCIWRKSNHITLPKLSPSDDEDLILPSMWMNNNFPVTKSRDGNNSCETILNMSTTTLYMPQFTCVPKGNSGVASASYSSSRIPSNIVMNGLNNNFKTNTLPHINDNYHTEPKYKIPELVIDSRTDTVLKTPQIDNKMKTPNYSKHNEELTQLCKENSFIAKKSIYGGLSNRNTILAAETDTRADKLSKINIDFSGDRLQTQAHFIRSIDWINHLSSVMNLSSEKPALTFKGNAITANTRINSTFDKKPLKSILKVKSCKNSCLSVSTVKLCSNQNSNHLDLEKLQKSHFMPIKKVTFCV